MRPSKDVVKTWSSQELKSFFVPKLPLTEIIIDEAGRCKLVRGSGGAAGDPITAPKQRGGVPRAVALQRRWRCAGGVSSDPSYTAPPFARQHSVSCAQLPKAPPPPVQGPPQREPLRPPPGPCHGASPRKPNPRNSRQKRTRNLDSAVGFGSGVKPP